MLKYLKEAILLAALGTVMITLFLLDIISSLMFLAAGVGVLGTAVVLLAVMTARSIAKQTFKKEPSIWALFVIGDISAVAVLFGAAFVITDPGARKILSIVFFFGSPIFIALPVFALIMWISSKTYRSPRYPEHPHGENCTCEECTHNGREEQ